MAVLHVFLLVGSMWVILDALLSSVIVSPHVLWGLPRGFLQATGKFKILWSQWISSLLATCPYHLSLLFLITCPILTRPIDWRRSSFLFLSHSDVLHIHVTILISAFLIPSTLDKFNENMTEQNTVLHGCTLHTFIQMLCYPCLPPLFYAGLVQNVCALSYYYIHTCM